jgi:hemerythrin
MAEFVQWQKKYEIGIDLIDEQHRRLFALTNELYGACLISGELARETFIKAAHAAVDYVKEHFSAEEQILEAINYPKLEAHKKQHEVFIKKVLESSHSFNTVSTNVAYEFARFLRDWILSHIMVDDKEYAIFISKKKRNGLSA